MSLKLTAKMGNLLCGNGHMYPPLQRSGSTGECTDLVCIDTVTCNVNSSLYTPPLLNYVLGTRDNTVDSNKAA